MARYQVTWVVDTNADNPLAALRNAIEKFPHEKQENEFGAPTIFDVKEITFEKGKSKTHRIDVMHEGCNPFYEDDVKEFNGVFADSHLLLGR